MKFKMIIDRDREEEIVVYAHERSQLVEDIEKLVLAEQKTIVGYSEKEMKIISPNEAECFISFNGKVYAQVDSQRYHIKMRLFQIEEMLGSSFIKINQSCIANVDKIKCFKADAYGGLIVVFKSGYSDYVSRRNIKAVKKRLGV